MQDLVPKKNILLIAYEFPPRGGVGGQRSGKFAKYLPDFGYNPVVLTATQDVINLMDETLLQQVADVTVFRCRGHEGLVQRLPRVLDNLLRLCILPDTGAVTWVPRAKRMALEIHRRYPISAVYTSVGPFSSTLLGRKVKRLLGVPWVLDFRDPWTNATIGLWPTKFHHWLEVRQERRALEAADGVVVVTPTMKDLLVRKYPHWENKIHVICNGYDAADFENVQGTVPSDRLQIGYAGHVAGENMTGPEVGPIGRSLLSRLAYRNGMQDGTTRSPLYLFRAVRELLAEHPQWEEKIAICFAGTVSDEARKLARDLQVEKVVSFKGHLPHAQAIQVLMDSDVLFLPIQAETTGQRSYILSGKAFEYLATGRPILGAVPEGDLSDLLRRVRAGWCVHPRDVGAMKSLLEELIEKKLAGTLHADPDRAFIKQFERRELTRRMAEVFDSLL
jgi:glycosyltransferase involved in cell wall biosynthesis